MLEIIRIIDKCSSKFQLVEQICNFQVNELREELEARSLSPKGLKSQLTARLAKVLKTEQEKEEEENAAKTEGAKAAKAKEDEKDEEKKKKEVNV